ncbi:hypothetical protein [Phenylobacterium sp.]|uniref:anti-sigma factor family protein n=1 Tax=Phenylobacterium sp. TaxID=1871053 RepID=UPI002F40D488
MTEEARIIAYVDGELDAAARLALEADMAADPALAGRMAGHRRIREAVGDAFAGVLDEPVPQRLRAAAAAPPPRHGFGRLPQWAALAACLAIGVLVGRGLAERGPLTAGPDGALAARGALAAALTRRLADDPVGPIKVGLSFRDGDRRYCRTFESPHDALAGIACREGGRWRVSMTAAYRPPPAADYRQAASATSPAVLAAVDGMIAGAPLDRAGERAARAQGWAAPGGR